MMMVKMTKTVMMLELKQSFSIQKIEQVLYLISQMLTVMTVPNKKMIVYLYSISFSFGKITGKITYCPVSSIPCIALTVILRI